MNQISTVALLVLALLGSAASAAPVVTNISANVVDISGNQLPVNLRLGDTVTFNYQYDNSGNLAHNYYLDGRVESVPISTYPHLMYLSDASVTFSQNILDTMSEYHGTSGYQTFNSNWAWTENSGSQFMNSWISPATNIHLGYSLSNPLSPFWEGRMTLWGLDPITNVNIWGATIRFDFTEVSTLPAAPVPEPETYVMMLAGLGLLGVMTRRRKANKQA